jgi:hypothetical protein
VGDTVGTAVRDETIELPDTRVAALGDRGPTVVETFAACTSKVKENIARRKIILKHTITLIDVMLLMPLSYDGRA